MTEPSFSAALDAAVAEQRKQGPECAVGRALRTLPDAASLQAALDNDAIYHTVIAKALKATGTIASSQSVSRHRRKACSCA